MKLYIITLTEIIFILSSVKANSYRLNVPKILLPFYSSKITNFTLEAKSELEPDTDDLCFTWSSSRPDIVSITPIYENRNAKFNGYDCSHRAIVSALSKHSQRMTSIIFAKDIKTNKLIRCDVIVDQIHSIRIKHTTTHLYLEDSPESLTAEALDSESNTFTSIDGLPFEWKVFNDETTFDDSRNVLRIAKFIDSEYEVSDSIKQLESLGLHGHKILIEGLKTGSANVQAKLIDPFYKDFLKTPPVRLMVVANILIEPSYPVYLLRGTSIRYSVYLIKQTSVEKISLPSQQYYFESENKSVAKFDLTGCQLMANQLGTTEIILVDRNMDEKLFKDQNIGLKPPSVLVHVVQAEYLVFFLKNWRSWILESGREYEIEILLHTKDDNLIYSADNLRIESEFPKFSVRDRSQNGSYVVAKTLEKGVTLIKGLLKEKSKVMVVEPVGIFLDPCPVEALVKSRLEINVKMNGLMQDGSMVSINDCSKISFNVSIQDETVFKYIEVVAADRMGENCAKIILDAEKVGKSLIQVFYGELKSQEMKIFSLSQLTSLKKNLLLTKSSSYLFSLSDGPFLNSDIHSYVSEFRINPHHLVNVEHLEHDSLASKYTYKITCLDTNDFENEIEFTIWNKATSQNKCPMKFKYKLVVRCRSPKILDLSQLFVNNDDSEQEVYSGIKWNCPIKLNSKFAVANLNRDLNIQLLVKDSSGKEFDNFTSLKSVWKFDSHFISKPKEVKFLNLKPLDQNTLAKETNFGYHTLFYQSLVPNKRAGETKIELKLYTDKNNYLENFLNIRFVNDVRVEPSQLVLFNHPSNIQQLKLFDGSGYFHAEVESKEKNLLKINHIWDSGIQVSPLTNNGLCFINVFDYCMPPQSFDLAKDEFSWEPTARSSVKVAGINSILVNYEDDKVQEGQQIKIFVQIVDASGNFIQSNYFKLMNLEAKIDSDLSLFKIESSNELTEPENTGLFILTGLKPGFLNIRFEAKSDSNIIKSTEKTLEIFEPIRVEPKMVELILGTDYQIKYTGGPVLARDMNIKFEIMDDYKFIEINQVGLVKATALGTCHVSVKFTNTKKLYTQDSVEFRIVEAKFAKIRSPLTSVKSGNKFPVHILLNNLNPLYFATSKNIQYKWSVNDVALAEILRNDGFSVHVITKEPGLLKISVSVFYMDKEFLDSVEVKIFAPAIFSNFGQQVPPDNIILATAKTMLQLRTNYDSLSSEIKYSLQFGMEENGCSDSKVQISGDGLLKITDPRTECHVGLQTRVHFESKIKEISYRMIEFDDQKLSVSYHDNLGDEFYVVNTKNSLTTNRNDLNIFGTDDSISFLTQSKDNSFQMRRLNDGFLLMELSANYQSDFIGLETKHLPQRVQEKYIGDLICNHTAQSSPIIKSVKSSCCYIGVAFEPGSIVLDNNREYLVRDLDRVYFLNENNILTNAHKFHDSQKSSNFVEFTANPDKTGAECSNEFECVFTAELSPFECQASLYNTKNEHINHLDRLIKTEVSFKNKNWICKINFAPSSDSELYDLMSNYLDKSNRLSHLDQEPNKIKIDVKSKNALSDLTDSKSHIFKFTPAFSLKTKIIELSLSGNSHSNLVIKAASFTKANLIVSTNVPSLIRIEEMSAKDFTIIFDIEKIDSRLNLDEFVRILQINHGNLYVQVLDTLTQQVEQIPIKFGSADLSVLDIYKTGQLLDKTKSLFSFTPNAMTQFLILLLLIFICILLYYKLNPPVPTKHTSPHSPVDRPSSMSSFNPYQYFTQSVNSSPTQRSRIQTPFNRSFDSDQMAPEPRLFSTNTNESYLSIEENIKRKKRLHVDLLKKMFVGAMCKLLPQEELAIY
ncbi:nuclear pore membrane glycoprotein [Brachionus plicatilis]|uniref:Nuclear pore membrane glycoprotein n=1 Tax=Brachionus plicatilis TaxID=10195 RepID=A0A3M7RAK3_BRAPC|nr:nuclear pore membrane glycoprotein [Brachionus plicatilis]